MSRARWPLTETASASSSPPSVNHESQSIIKISGSFSEATAVTTNNSDTMVSYCADLFTRFTFSHLFFIFLNRKPVSLLFINGDYV